MTTVADEAPEAQINCSLNEARRLEAVSFTGWPCLRLVHDGSWLIRFAGGYTKRANSVNFLDPLDEENAPGRIDEAVRLYHRQAIEPVIRITPLTPASVSRELDRRGWERFDRSHAMAGPLLPIVEAAAAADVFDEATCVPRDWFDALSRLNALDARQQSVLLKMLNAVTGDRAFISLTVKGVRHGAVALAVRQGTIVSIYEVFVAPELRQLGAGRRLIETCMGWGRAGGAQMISLNVQADNAAAIKLYRSCGLERRYDYYYRRAPRAKFHD